MNILLGGPLLLLPSEVFVHPQVRPAGAPSFEKPFEHIVMVAVEFEPDEHSMGRARMARGADFTADRLLGERRESPGYCESSATDCRSRVDDRAVPFRDQHPSR